MTHLRALDLFAGMGGLGLAGQRAGLDIVYANEFDKYPADLHDANFVRKVDRRSIVEVPADEVPPHDVMLGGFPCFAAGTPVLTARGMVPIEDVMKGDLVWTHEARWRAVTDTMVRESETVEFRPGFYSTPEHRLWMREAEQVWDPELRRKRRHLHEPDWVRADESKGKFFAVPTTVSGIEHDKPETLTWWQVGRWVADGHGGSSVFVSIGKGKLDDIEMFPGWYDTDRSESTVKLRMPNSKSEATWLTDNFGSGAANKTIPAFVLSLPGSQRLGFLRGYWSGDGHDVRGGRGTASVSVSPALSIGIMVLASSLGYSSVSFYQRTPDTTVIEGRTVNQRDYWRITAMDDDHGYTTTEGDFVWRRVRKNPAPGGVRTVYDLTVEEDHSFVAAGIVVHNCQAFSITGRRGGFEDERGKMFPEMLRIAAHHHTPLIVMENVKGLVSHDKGRTLETILRWLREAGYSAAWQVMSSWAHAGIPQARERVFIVASLTNPVGQSIFPMPLGGLPNPAETNTWRAFLDPAEEIPERYWYTPESQMGRLFAETLAREDRVYRFMGRTGVWGLHDNDKGLVPTLVASDGGGKVPSILDRVYKHHRADELRVHEMAPTMLANMGTGGGKVPMVLEQGEGVLRPRKLTERECARLQGFPDDYKMDVVSSTRQYRALGNSICVPLGEKVIRNALTLLD